MRTLQLLGGVVAAALWLMMASGTAVAGAEEGKKIFDQKKCINCHTLGEQAGPMAKLGGPLDGVGSNRDAAWLKAYLTDPKSKIADAKMPKQKLTDEELNALVEYHLTLK